MLLVVVLLVVVLLVLVGINNIMGHEIVYVFDDFIVG